MTDSPEDLTPIDRLSRTVGNTACWLFLLAAAISCYEVLVDSAFRAPTVWVHDMTIMLCSSAFLLGGAYAMQRGDHIRITVVYDYFSTRCKRWADIFTSLLTLVYLSVLAYFTGTQAIDSIMRVERSGRAWDFPMPMVIRTMLFVGAVLLTLQGLSQLYRLVRRPVVD